MAHFAEMGGYHLETPGYPTFPLTAHQLAFLISKGYVDFPAEDESDIDDKNKRDGLARYVLCIVTIRSLYMRPFFILTAESLKSRDHSAGHHIPNQEHCKSISTSRHDVA